MSPDSPAQRYHRRNRWPIVVVVAVLLVGAGVLWFQLLRPVPVASTGCNQPGPAPVVTSSSRKTTAAPTTGPATGTARSTAATTARSTGTTPTTPSVITSLGAFADPNSLTAVRPADPSTVTLQVFNASRTKGQAKTLTNDLQAAGFSSIAGGANDPLYPAYDLVCRAEIRYGQAGIAAARTLLYVAPCAQLVLDNRIDDSVDLALGGRYTYAPLSDAVKAQLKSIHDAALPRAVIEGQTAAARPTSAIPPLPAANCS